MWHSLANLATHYAAFLAGMVTSLFLFALFSANGRYPDDDDKD